MSPNSPQDDPFAQIIGEFDIDEFAVVVRGRREVGRFLSYGNHTFASFADVC